METRAPEHRLVVDKLGPQQFTVRCRCGWRGAQRNGKPFWNKGAAAGSALSHQKEAGIPLNLMAVDYMESYTDGRKRKK